MKPLACLLALLAAAGAPQSRTLEISVAAGRHDRANVPVRVAADLPDGVSVTLLDASGKAVPCQVTGPSLLSASGKKELHFVLESLKAGETASFKAVVSPGKGQEAAPFRWQFAEGDHAELRWNDRPILRYMHKALDESSPASREETYKVFHHLFDPGGKMLVTKGAGGQYTHHRGIFYGFNRVTYGQGKPCDIWHCKGAHQAHDGFLSSEAGFVLGRHRLAIRWHGEGKEVFAKEERELTVYNVPGGTLVEFASRLRAALAPVKLDGDPQHAGFHFRASNEVSEKTKKETYFVRPDGVGKPGETRNWDPKSRQGPVNLPWNAMSFIVGGRRFTAVYLDRPENPKEARFSERDYGRFGSYFVATVDGTRSLDVGYRIWLQEGEIKVEEAAARSAAFVEPPQVSVK